MSEVTTFNWTIDEDLAGYARHGFSGIEIWLNKAARNGAPYDKLPAGEVPLSAVQELTDALVGTGLQAVSVVCGGDLTEPDDERWRSGSSTCDLQLASPGPLAPSACWWSRATSMA